jgi:hypothetical protein
MVTVSGNLSEVQKTLEETKRSAEEMREREARSTNFIIYRVPETNVSAEERAKLDKTFCMDLIREALEVEIHDNDFKKVIRLSKKGIPERPLLVQLKERSTKNRVMISLYKLKHAEDKFKNVSIAHDLSQIERDDCKLLVAQAKQKEAEETGEWIWRVRGAPGMMKVVKFRKQ